MPLSGSSTIAYKISVRDKISSVERLRYSLSFAMLFRLQDI